MSFNLRPGARAGLLEPSEQGLLGPDAAGTTVRYYGRRATIVSIQLTPLPKGGEISLARIRFPRGGEQTVFTAQLSRVVPEGE